MKVKIYNNKRIELTEKDYKIIKRRFNYKKYKKITNEYGSTEFMVTLSCPLCDKYHKNLSHASCPVDIFRKNSMSGCMVLIHKILKIPANTNTVTEFYATPDDAGYLEEFKEEAEKQLDKINKFLDTFE
jgi:hypothetical protein